MTADAADAAVVRSRCDAIRARIKAAGADPATVTIVAVTKGFGPDAVEAALAAGLGDIGENYAQELLAKRAAVGTPGAVWHFIGKVQRNKVRSLAAVVDVWETVDRPEIGRAIAGHAPGARVLVEVNTSQEPTKAGCRLDEAPALIDQLRTFGLDVRGLMTVGPAGPPEAGRSGFAALADLARRLALPELSMGMTADLEVAVQEGATMVRVGTGLFGPRRARAATIG